VITCDVVSDMGKGAALDKDEVRDRALGKVQDRALGKVRDMVDKVGDWVEEGAD
jgi:hypothetical protein